MTDASGQPIINPATGKPYTVTSSNYYTFTGAAGQVMSFQVMSASITSIKDPFDTTLTIYGPNGQRDRASTTTSSSPPTRRSSTCRCRQPARTPSRWTAFHTTDPTFNDPSAQNYNPAAYYHAQHGAYELFMYTFSAYNALQPPSVTNNTAVTLVLPTAPAGSTQTVSLNGV